MPSSGRPACAFRKRPWTSSRRGTNRCKWKRSGSGCFLLNQLYDRTTKNMLPYFSQFANTSTPQYLKSAGILVHSQSEMGYIGTFRRNHSNKSPITVGLPDEGGVYWYISKYEVYWNTPTLGWGILAHFQISKNEIARRNQQITK